MSHKLVPEDMFEMESAKETDHREAKIAIAARNYLRRAMLESARPEALAFQEAVWLLEVCRSCDLVYDGPWGPTGPDVHVIVDAFLKKHKSVIEGYEPQCPESPRGKQ